MTSDFAVSEFDESSGWSSQHLLPSSPLGLTDDDSS